MEHKKEQKERFRFHNQKYFISDIMRDHQFYTQSEWDEAAEEYFKPLLREKTIEEYTEDIFCQMDNLIDLNIPFETLHYILMNWKRKIQNGIQEVIEKKRKIKKKSQSAKGIFEKNRKTIVPKLRDCVKAFELIKEVIQDNSFAIHGGHYGIAGYINEKGTIVEPGLSELGKIIKNLNVNKNSDIKIKTTIKNDLEAFHKQDYNDFLKIDLEVNTEQGIPQKLIFEFIDEIAEPYNYIDDLRFILMSYASNKYGDEGSSIIHTLLNEQKPAYDDTIGYNTIFKTKKKPRHKPEDIYLNRIILQLDYYNLDEIEIASLANVLENREHYKINRFWSRTKKKFVCLNRERIKKAIRQRIKKAGGNFLKHNIITYIKERNECTKCDWKYNETGEIIRYPCKKHRKSPKKISGRFLNPEGVRKYLEKKGLTYFSNAITYPPRKLTQKTQKIKKHSKFPPMG